MRRKRWGTGAVNLIVHVSDEPSDNPFEGMFHLLWGESMKNFTEKFYRKILPLDENAELIHTRCANDYYSSLRFTGFVLKLT